MSEPSWWLKHVFRGPPGLFEGSLEEATGFGRTRDNRDSVADDIFLVCADLNLAVVKTYPLKKSAFSSSPPSAPAQDGPGAFWSQPETPTSPALSTASTADGEDDLDSSPILPSLPVPRLSDRVSRLLRTPSPGAGDDRDFGTASWGSPYPSTDHNLRRQSFSSEASDDFPIHTLAIDTPFLRPAPELRTRSDSQPPLSAAAVVLANRVRRQTIGLTEYWIRTHTTDDLNDPESRHWFSDGSDSETEHSSLSGSEPGWLDEHNLRTPRAVVQRSQPSSRKTSRHNPRARSSVETLKPGDHLSPKIGQNASMETSQAESALHDAASDRSKQNTPSSTRDQLLLTPPPAAQGAEKPKERTNANGAPKRPSTPPGIINKPLPKEPAMTPRVKKKVPWRGKNILVLLPRDERRGLPGEPPRPLRQDEIERMFDSWQELGYDISGFDLEVEGYQPEGTADSQSRESWPNFDDILEERAQRFSDGGKVQVTLPDLDTWKNYVNELQEAKLRALGVSFGNEEPAPQPSISPALDPSRQPSGQYPGLPFSPPLPTSSAQSNHAMPGFPFPGQLGRTSATQSPGLPGASPVPFGHIPGKYNPRQSISLPASNSPFQMSQQSPQGWHPQAGFMQHRQDSPSLMNMNGLMSPQSPFEFQPSGSPAFNMHQRHQSLQYPVLPHQQQFQQQPLTRVSPRLHDVREDEEEPTEDVASKMVNTPQQQQQQQQQNPDTLQAEIDDAEYHLEEQFRNQLEHEDYNPQVQPHPNAAPHMYGSTHDHQIPNDFPLPERFANEPAQPLVLHHPRPHSRGHSLSQKFFRDSHEAQNGTKAGDAGDAGNLSQLNDIPEPNKQNDAYEVETNPSNLGTPIQNFDFSQPPFGQHHKTFSSTSNPWNEDGSGNDSDARRSGHESKSSLTKLNVQAPEFKFNPTSTFTPGQFNLSSSNFQPPVVPVAVHNVAVSPISNPVSEFTREKPNATAPSFSPGNGDFNFSFPRFNPDAQAFTPNQSLSGADNAGAPGSIFGNINLNPDEVVMPTQESKAGSIIKPDSRSPSEPPESSVPPANVVEDERGNIIDESRFKRTKSAAADGDDVPLFAEQPHEADEVEIEQLVKDDHSIVDDDHVVPVDTSLSSITSDQMDTKATTTAPSESSPAAQHANHWGPFEFTSKLEVQSFNDAIPFGEDNFLKHSRERTLSASAPAFTPGAASFGEAETPVAKGRQTPLSSTESSDTKQPPASLAVSQFSSPPPGPRSGSQGPKSAMFSSPPAEPRGLAASRFAEETPSPITPSPAGRLGIFKDVGEFMEPVDEEADVDAEIQAMIQASNASAISEERPTYEEIDEVMRQMGADPNFGVHKSIDIPQWRQHAVANSSALRVDRNMDDLTKDEASRTTRQYHALADSQDQPRLSTEIEDPFIDPPQSGQRSNVESLPPSDWEAAFTEDEHDKLNNRAQFFDSKVSDVVGNLLDSRLEPLEKSIFSIQNVLAAQARQTPSSRRDVRSLSAEFQHSDADDEDEDPIPHRSMSPRRDRRLEHIRIAVMEAMAVQQRSQPTFSADASMHSDNAAVLGALENMAQSFSNQQTLGDELRGLMENAVQQRTSADMISREEHTAKIFELEQRLYVEQAKTEKEMADRRAAQELTSELNHKLQSTEARVEVEIINRSVYDQRVADLEERLRQQERKSEEELEARRAAEDKLAEDQRLLRISSEEENRLREILEERDQRMLSLEQANGQMNMRIALLDASENNSTQSQSELTSKLTILETDLRNVRQDNHHWRAEAERADEAARNRAAELSRVAEENQYMQKTLSTLTTQLEENERLRESWRGKFMSLQDDMASAAREIAEENARRIKRDQATLARHEVLDARLQAEAKTRERLEAEMDRLQTNERTGIRAVNECKRLENILGELKTENHKLEQKALRYHRDYEEARESGAIEVKRTHMALQTEIDSANNQVNVIREELEEQVSKLRAELDHVRLEADTAKAQNEMLLEEAQTTKTTEIEELKRKHQDEIEDLQTRYERQVNNAQEDGQKAEQLLLDRLSLSTSRTEHLQDRILHLEDKLEIAQQAAAAAAAAAKAAGVEPGSAAIIAQNRGPASAPAPAPAPAPRTLEAPEKISPQALRESIMVLQEQLQAREQRIEELEQQASKFDPGAATKITKRDDEISWLRELLAVRHENLQDIINALSGDAYNRDAVKDAAIRLKANLQMEEQERERAVNGGSAISLPSIAQSIQAATPSVAQRIAPIAAAWGSWRRSNQASFSSIAGALTSPTNPRDSTPSKSGLVPANKKASSGLLTPPVSGLRQIPPVDNDRPQPTAFASTGRRYPSQSGMQNRDETVSNSSRSSDKKPSPGTHPPESSVAEPLTPLMMQHNVYDSDAQPGDFDDHDFFED